MTLNLHLVPNFTAWARNRAFVCADGTLKAKALYDGYVEQWTDLCGFVTASLLCDKKQFMMTVTGNVQFIPSEYRQFEERFDKLTDARAKLEEIRKTFRRIKV